MQKSSVLILICMVLLTSVLSACNNTQSTDVSVTEPTTEVSTPNSGEQYEFIDDMPTTPTAEPHNRTERPSELQTVSLKGDWKPLMATQVADSKEIAFNQAFGTIYMEEGGMLSVEEDGSFTLKMGVAVEEGKSKGKFSISDYHLIVTYADKTPDTFLYIPNYRNCEVIKVQIDSYYVYFYKT